MANVWCCQSSSLGNAFAAEKLAANFPTGCITTNEEFPLVCLNMTMLTLLYFELHERKLPMLKEVQKSMLLGSGYSAGSWHNSGKKLPAVVPS